MKGRFSINTMPKFAPQYPTSTKTSSKFCQEHTMNLVEVWQGDIKLDEYCPVCLRERMKEGGE